MHRSAYIFTYMRTQIRHIEYTSLHIFTTHIYDMYDIHEVHIYTISSTHVDNIHIKNVKTYI